MTADSYEWLPPSSPARGYRLTSAIKAAEAEIDRRKRREAVLAPALCNDQAWMILLHVFTEAGGAVSVDRIAHKLSVKKPEILRWLLALESQRLLVVVGKNGRVFLTASCQRILVEYFTEPFSSAFLRRKFRLATPKVAAFLSEASIFLLSFVLLVGATIGPFLPSVTRHQSKAQLQSLRID